MADTLARDKPIAVGECERLPTADELAAQPRWTFFMAWAELVQSGNSVQPIQDLDNAANMVTVREMSELSKKISDEALHSGVPTSFTPRERR